MTDHLTSERIQTAVAGASLVVAASVKCPVITERVFGHIPEDAIFGYNPGSSEVIDYPEALRRLMSRRRPTILGLNSEELAELMGEHPDTDPRELIGGATEFAERVLCTWGTEGVLLGRNGQFIHQPANVVPPELVVDDLGAGDRAFGIAIEGVVHGMPDEEIAKAVVEGTTPVLMSLGGHGDLLNIAA
jgi:sugar/nucleoside kinase (ribokinase family)